jgi:hypothetical protein
MDLTAILADYIEELLGLHSAYALTDIDSFDRTADAAALVRLRVRVCESLIGEGWTPGAAAAAQLERDRRLLLEPDDEDGPVVKHSQEEEQAAIRARASRVRDEARRTRGEIDRARAGRADVQEELEQMRRALDSRAVIEQAKGIAMERYGVRADVAWSWLVRTSQNRNLKLRVLAEELVESAFRSVEEAESRK